ncbi:glycosyltransferase family 4 protein [Pseudomonas sp. LS-2]|uniref:glycosyltransferase family 4 protein n=1 Tax=Pseudomonas sp. LS-2 TaxID=2315859 RepID=UPI000E72FAF5|nr:glycosyltransferase family 4 protein [Pseudomonas sp. LS-2]RJX82791.1 glycosyltransferase [Pseudomonas sp. LS-2]
MKIVFFVHCFFPDHFYGTETYTIELAKNYASWGHDVTVVTAIFQGEPAAAELISHYEYEGIKVISLDKNKIPHGRIKETYYQPDMRTVLTQVLTDLQPDIVHVTHLINHTSVLLEVTSALGIATYATFTDFFGFCLNNKLEAADGALCAGPSKSRANCVACYIKEAARANVGGWMGYAKSPLAAKVIASSATALRKLPGLKNGSIDGTIEDIARRPDTLISLYNQGYKGAVAPTAFLKKAYLSNDVKVPMHALWFGIDIDRSPKPERPADHVPTIGFIGQIAPHKGTDLLVDAFQQLPAQRAKLKIYGPADQDPAYMQELRSKAEGGDIEFLGTFDKGDMVNILRDLDLLVIPSKWYENSPLVLLNALATHTPVLVSDVLGMTEFLEPGLNGLSFERGSATDLHRQLAALVTEPHVLYGMSKTTNYERTPEVMARETFAMYGE